jgi:Mn-containing catalase
MRETTIYKEHDTLVREYLHIKMFLKKLQNMKDEQKKFNLKVHEVIKLAKEKMYEAAHADADGWDTVIDLDDVIKILDDLIEESEDKE